MSAFRLHVLPPLRGAQLPVKFLLKFTTGRNFVLFIVFNSLGHMLLADREPVAVKSK